MKNLRLLEMSLISPKEKKAKKIKFHPRTTVILGQNDTGKSCLLKNIYATFGAGPISLDAYWRSANVISLVKFKLDNEVFFILNSLGYYSLFNSEKKIIKSFNSITDELGPYLSRLLNFGIKLTNRENETVSLPPAYFFLPFYIDQDQGWTKNWASFGALQQFSAWRRPVIEYHAGIYPNEYYEAKAGIAKLENEKQETENELEIIKKVVERVSKKNEPIFFDVSIEAFEKEIEELLVKCQELKKIEEKLQSTMVDLNNKKIKIEEQERIVGQAKREFQEDYKYATFKINEDHIPCPTCGQEYENAFAERFLFARDENRCYEFLIELQSDKAELEEKLRKEKVRHDKNHALVVEINALLETKKSAVKLRNLIESEGKKEVKKDLGEEVESTANRIFNQEEEIKNLKSELKKYDDKDRKQLINDFYFNHMRKYIIQLDIHKYSQEKYKQLSCQIEEQGSDLPRGLLAYYYSVIHTIQKYSTSTFAPIVIDSPNQQGQDTENIKSVINFIFSEQPSDSQLILGIEDLRGVKVDGDVIELKQDRSLLQAEEYDGVWKEVKPLMDLSLK